MEGTSFSPGGPDLLEEAPLFEEPSFAFNSRASLTRRRGGGIIAFFGWRDTFNSYIQKAEIEH